MLPSRSRITADEVERGPGRVLRGGEPAVRRVLGLLDDLAARATTASSVASTSSTLKYGIQWAGSVGLVARRVHDPRELRLALAEGRVAELGVSPTAWASQPKTSR